MSSFINLSTNTAANIADIETSERTIAVQQPKQGEAGLQAAQKVEAELQAKRAEAERKPVEVDEKDIDEALAVISDFMSRPPRNINFTKDNDSGRTVIKVFNSDNQELIKQFPSDEVLSVAQKIKDLQQTVGSKSGILFDENI